MIATSVRVAAYKGTIALPPDAEQLITVLARHRPTILVSFGSPYLIAQVPTVHTYLLAWTANALTETAVAEALSGGPITGHAPIAIPPSWDIGAGLQRTGH